MHALALVLLVAGFLVLTGLQIWLNTGPVARRGRAARAANGGRHTTAWWLSIAALIVIAVGLLAFKF